MPIGLVLVFVLVPALWVGGVRKADRDWHERWPYSTSSCRPYQYYGFWAHLVPWPLRQHASYELPPKDGDKNLCTGEIFNGRWWYKETAK